MLHKVAPQRAQLRQTYYVIDGRGEARWCILSYYMVSSIIDDIENT